MLQDLYRSVLCNINAGSITLHEALHDGIVYSVGVGLQANIHVWLSHGTISIALAAEPGGGGGGQWG